MNQFDESIKQAKAIQRKNYIFVVAGIFLAAVIVFGVIIGSNGTRLVIQPPEASEIAQISISNGIYIEGSVYSVSSSPVLTVLAEGFKPVNEPIPQAHIGRNHQVKMFELPGKVTIKTNTDTDTKWTIDGRKIAIAPTLEKELEAGSYSVGIDNPYFIKDTHDIKIKRNEELNTRIMLTPIEGTVSIKSKPMGASVTVDGEMIGQTPVAFKRQGGKYRVQVEAENHQQVIDVIDIKRGYEQLARIYNLKPKRAALLVKVSPTNGALLVNGIEARPGMPMTVDALKTYKVSYSKLGYFASSQDVTVNVGEMKEISFNLKLETGQVEIDSSPSAEVFINGRSKGVTPYKARLSAVLYKVELKKAGYRTVRKSIRPSARSTQRISAKLITEIEARRAEAKTSYMTFAGGKMQMFKPNEIFSIGAERHEKGQRANEFVHKIKLDRDFYAGVHEVSNKEFEKFNRSKAKGAGNEPVTNVSWSDAAAFCNWLSKKEKLSPVYITQGGKVVGFDENADGYRMLTEAEWEWLARKAKKNKRTIFTWGNQTVIPANAANVADKSAHGSVKFYVPNYTDGFAGIAPVGSFKQEKSGLYDMAGNVSEYVHDTYSIVPPIANRVEDNPMGNQSGSAYVVKGANYKSGSITTIRPAFRESLNSERNDVGFRLGRYLY